MSIRLHDALSTVILPTMIHLPDTLPTAILFTVFFPMTIRSLLVCLITANLTLPNLVGKSL